MSSTLLPDINSCLNRGRTKISPTKRFDHMKFKKLATGISIDKLIKSNDITSIMTRDTKYPKKFRQLTQDDEVSDILSNLVGFKRSCDDLKRKMQIKEQQIELMRKQIDQMNQDQEDFNQNEAELQKTKKSVNLGRDFSINKFKQDEALMTKKTYEQMLLRMKKDSLVYQQREGQAEENLTKSTLKLQGKSKSSKRMNEENHLTISALVEVQKGVEQSKHNRSINLQKFKDDLKLRQDIQKKKEDRGKRQDEIAENAAGDVYGNNMIKWRKLYLVHSFLNQFLRIKMQKEINKFADVENGFHQIKAATGISNANEIVSKFLGREKTYSHLLINVKQLEKKIEALKLHNQQLQGDLDKFVDTKDDYEEADVEPLTPMGYSSQSPTDVQQRALLCTVLMSRLTSWVQRNLTKLGRAGFLDNEEKVEGNREGLLKIISILRPQLLTLSEEDQKDLITQQMNNQKASVNDINFQQKMIRVKPPQNRSISKQEQITEQQMGDEDDDAAQNHTLNLREDIKLKTDSRKKK